MDLNKQKELLNHLTILYVEDIDEVAQYLSSFLTRRFQTVHRAHDGKEALTIFKKHKEFIDLVITDIRMPHIDGLELSRMIKEISFKTPVIITTAFTDNEYTDEAKDIGIDGYITKPIENDALVHLILSVTNKYES